MTKSQIVNRAYTIIEKAKKVAKNSEARNRCEDMQIYENGYAEPGYDSDKVVILGNWNSVKKYNQTTRQFDLIDDTPERVGNLLEKLGCELEWCDEWAACSECGKLIRTQGNSYGWTPSYAILHSDFVCHSCIKSNSSLMSDYLDDLENDPSKAITLDIDPTEHDYVLLSDNLENGFYGGQSDDLKVIAKSLRDKKVFRFIFKIDSVGQFDMDFSVYVHKDEIDLVNGPIETQGVDPAKVLSEGLKNAKVKVVSPQDFVDGKMFD